MARSCSVEKGGSSWSWCQNNATALADYVELTMMSTNFVTSADSRPKCLFALPYVQLCIDASTSIFPAPDWKRPPG